MGNGASVKNEKVVSLGTGRFASIDCIRVIETGKLIAVKRFKPTTSEKLLNQELQTLQAIKGHSCYLQDLVENTSGDELPYLVLEPYLGGPLSVHIQRSMNSRLPVGIARSYMCEIISGIQHMHSCGVIHRDLKADNVLLDATGRLKICDFGCAKLLFNLSSQNETISNDISANNLRCKVNYNVGRAYTITGSLHNMSPEMVAYGTPRYPLSTTTQCSAMTGIGYDYSVDWWAVGVLLFEMIVGTPPYWKREVQREGNLTIENNSLMTEDNVKEAHSAEVMTMTWPDCHAAIVAQYAIEQSRDCNVNTLSPLHAIQPIDTVQLSTDTMHNTLLDLQSQEAWYLSLTDQQLLVDILKHSESEISQSVDKPAHCDILPVDTNNQLGNTNTLTEYTTDLITRLLCINPQSRLGCNNSLPQLLAHPYFMYNNSKYPTCDALWSSVHSGLSAVGDVDFDRRFGFLELCKEYDLKGDIVSEEEQMLFADF